MPDEARLAALEEHGRHTEKQLGELSHQVRNLAQVQAGQTAKLDRIADAVSRQEYAPRFDFQRSVQTVRDLFVISGTLGALAIWLVVTLTAATDQVTEVRIQSIMRDQHDMKDDLKRFNWVPKLEGRTP
jgi:uncharacterized coiled-coil protein SlyX